MSGLTERLVLAARHAGVIDERVLAAIAATPRRAFVPPEYARMAYEDVPVPIPHGQVTSQPSLCAMMIAALGLGGEECVLEVGTGYGYQSALLARLAATVLTVEIWPDLAARARHNLASQRISNVRVVAGDGTQGYPAAAPYDAVVLAAAFPTVPPPLAAQLRQHGRLVQPIGPGGSEDVVLFEKSGSRLRRQRVLTPASFVRLRGKYGYQDEGE